jgi:hypothetical protein
MATSTSPTTASGRIFTPARGSVLVVVMTPS